MCIIDRIQKAIDDRNYCCGIFLDFSKAFDTINHNILIRKLQHYGVRGLALDWFISYLSNRNQIVTVNGVQSELLSIPCGIPQGPKVWNDLDENIKGFSLLSLRLITLFCNFYSTRFCLCVCLYACVFVCMYVCESSRPFIIYYRLCIYAGT